MTVCVSGIWGISSRPDRACPLPIDLREPIAAAAARIELGDAVAPWQDTVATGGTPASWTVRDRLTELGAHGLIDPSRTSPGLWHLVLFCWNTPGSPTVTRLVEACSPAVAG